jgi:hypothetical protein
MRRKSLSMRRNHQFTTKHPNLSSDKHMNSRLQDVVAFQKTGGKLQQC